MNIFFRKIKNSQQGLSTLEMLIAMTLIVLVIGSVLPLVSVGQSTSIDSQTNQEALYKAQKLIETARADATQDFNLVNPISSSPDADPFYAKGLGVKMIDFWTKEVTSVVSWLGENGKNLTASITTRLTNPTAASGGDTCDPTISGDWTAPQVYGYADFPSSTGATGIDVRGNKAYVTSDPSSANTDDFYIINVNDPTQKPLPILGHFSTGYGLTDVRTVGAYSYVTADSAQYQLLVIDVSDSKNLNTSKIIARRDVTTAGDTAYGNTIFYADQKIYLGLTISDGPEFHIFDVSSPANPAEIGLGYEVGSAINDIVVKNNIAYLATADDNEVIALDISNPANPTPIGTFSSVTLTGQSLALDKGTTLYFGRIGGNGNPKLLAFDTTNLSTPKWTMSMDKQSGVYVMILRNNLLFMTTADPNDGLQIWDVSNPSGPPIRYDTSPLDIQQNATAGSTCSGNLLYVAQRSNKALQIIGPRP